MKFSIESLFFSKEKEVRDRRAIKGKNKFKTNNVNMDDVDEGRRRFIKGALKVATAAAVASIPGNKFIEKEAEGMINYLDRDKAKESVRELMDELASQRAEEDARPIKELINYHTVGRIDLTRIDVQEILKNYWKKRYKESEGLRSSLERAYYEMGSYDKRLKRIFKKAEVPEEYCYLAIPESHWDVNQRSGAGAVGYYQFTAETARRRGLNINDGNDERKDPLRSAWACAQELKYLYEKTKDWDLALSGYNGGQIWGYLHKDNKKNRNVPPYKDFLKYIEVKVNRTRDEIKHQEYKQYEVASGDTVGKIAQLYNLKKEVIISLNGIKDDKIKKGQILKIPYSEEQREKDFNAIMEKAGYFENLTYPAKFNAVNELIKEKFVYAQRQPEELKERRVAVIEPKPGQTKVRKA